MTQQEKLQLAISVHIDKMDLQTLIDIAYQDLESYFDKFATQDEIESFIEENLA